MSRCPNCGRNTILQEHEPGCRGMVPPERAAEHASRQLIVGLEARVAELEQRLKDIREAHDIWRNGPNTPDINLMLDASLSRALNPNNPRRHYCGSPTGSVTWCCEKHAAEDGEGLVKQREQAVLAAAEVWHDADINDPDPADEALRVAVLALRGVT